MSYVGIYFHMKSYWMVRYKAYNLFHCFIGSSYSSTKATALQSMSIIQCIMDMLRALVPIASLRVCSCYRM